MNWIVSQLGAREHYAIARALNRAGALRGLLTDLWMQPQSLLAKCGGTRLRERFHPDLAEAPVRAWNAGLIIFELAARAKHLSGWSLTLARNCWFQRKVVSALSTYQPSNFNSQPILFSYSYTAKEPFEFARKLGWKTVLGQIDAGLAMERIVKELANRYGDARPTGHPPEKYWQVWREECVLADQVVVNSNWSRDCLIQEGVSSDKVVVIPLAYQPPAGAAHFKRTVPKCFMPDRPLRILFLGQITFLKGIVPLLEAMEELQNEPIELSVVGRELCEIPPHLRGLPNVNWIGSVPRGITAKYYQSADAFIFPTFSDGFGLTQLEAQAWKLPVVASRFCGEVVKDGVNGLLLKEVSAEAIASALRRLLKEPSLLHSMSEHSAVGAEFSLEAIASALVKL